MAKKFKDLKKGDSIWRFNKMDIVGGFQEKTLTEDFKSDKTGEAYVAETTTDVLEVCIIDKKYFGKSVYPSRYEIWATSLEELRKASEQCIKKELGTLQKQINKQLETIRFIEKRKENISKLLMQ